MVDTWGTEWSQEKERFGLLGQGKENIFSFSLSNHPLEMYFFEASVLSKVPIKRPTRQQKCLQEDNDGDDNDNDEGRPLKTRELMKLVWLAYNERLPACLFFLFGKLTRLLKYRRIMNTRFGWFMIRGRSFVSEPTSLSLSLSGKLSVILSLNIHSKWMDSCCHFGPTNGREHSLTS